MSKKTPHKKTIASVYTIHSGIAFVDALAAGVMLKSAGSPEKLGSITIMLPTRRACRALQEAFLRLNNGKPMLLPQMTPLGDIDEDELALAGGDDETPGNLDVPEAISGIRRQLLLTKLIMAKKDIDMTPGQASRLAGELARLLDQVHSQQLSFDGLKGLVQKNDFSEHWQITLDFLKIITEQWPNILAIEGRINPAERRNQLLDTQARVWRNNPPDYPIIAAGSTGSVAATAKLLKTVSELPYGSLVLPGLDKEMSAESWQALGPTHPQFNMAQLLNHLAIERHKVMEWPIDSGTTIKAQPGLGRSRLINIALAPANAVAKNIATAITASDIDGVVRIDAADTQTEAAAIALIMRRSLEIPGQTAALVTPERSLARRVAQELQRWHIDIDDSAGQPLGETPPGTFLRLIARMIVDDLAPITLLGVIKHPLAALGQNPKDFRTWARQLEILLLRGPRPGPGIAGLYAALATKRQQALENSNNKKADALAALMPGLNTLENALKPFARLMNHQHTTVCQLLKAHITFAEILAATDKTAGAKLLWAKESGDIGANFVAEMNEAAESFVPINGNDYPDFLDSLMATRVVRPKYGRHPRLHIWGNLEARLQHSDIMILGGLNEDTWPPEAHANPWMSRPMAKIFGLPLPEHRIGLSAHDFVQAFAAKQIFLTRAHRAKGAPTVASRWLQRLDNLLASAGLANALDATDDWLGWAKGLDEPDTFKPVAPPAPTPPLNVRPRELPATRIETLIRDPYAIYARQILRLKPLDSIDADPDARQRGTTIHDALDKFIKAYPKQLPDDAEEKLIDIGRDEFDKLMAWPIVRALWWPRFERIAKWFVDWERQRRNDGVYTQANETKGHLDIDLAGGSFRLGARADRIDRLVDGSLAIIDYKTGATPTGRQIESGLAPQLPLEAIIAEAGGFDGVKKAEVKELLYVQLSGGREAGKTKRPALQTNVRQVIDKSRDGLLRLLGRYDMEKTPYFSRQRIQFQRYEGDYDHLARVKEWSLGSEGEEQ